MFLVNFDFWTISLILHRCLSFNSISAPALLLVSDSSKESGTLVPHPFFLNSLKG